MLVFQWLCRVKYLYGGKSDRRRIVVIQLCFPKVWENSTGPQMTRTDPSDPGKSWGKQRMNVLCICTFKWAAKKEILNQSCLTHCEYISKKNCANQELLRGILFYQCYVKEMLAFFLIQVWVFYFKCSFLRASPASLPQSFSQLSFQASLNTANHPHPCKLDTQRACHDRSKNIVHSSSGGSLFLQFLNDDNSTCQSSFIT